MVPQWIIEKKRDGGILSEAEIRTFVDGFTQGAIPDYQMSAFVCFLPACSQETPATDAMMLSGDLVTFDACPVRRRISIRQRYRDKLSLLIAPSPLAGLAVPMIPPRLPNPAR
jgi:pyrimidine-nucleoside phosphorylase